MEQAIMVPPNNAPWPGLQTPAPSQTTSHPPSYPPPHYYHHPAHPPPPHSPHQQPYYPYHPYPAAPYPYPYPHYPSSATPAPSSADTASVASSSTASKSIQAKPAASSSKKEPSSDSKPSATLKTFRFEGSISSETYKTTKSFDLAGVNILNRKPLDTRTALDKLQRRRETHNRVERKRRDCINQLIDDLTRLLPPKHLEQVTSKCHRVNVLRGAVAHIKFLAEQNSTLTKSLDAAKSEGFNVTLASETCASADNEAMDVDKPESVKQENMDDDNDETFARAEKTSSRSSSPSADSVSSRSTSPRLTPSKALDLPPVIITTTPSSSDKEMSQPESKGTLVAPPIITEHADADTRHYRSNSVSDCASPSSTFSASPLFPPSHQITIKSSSSAFPPSPVSPLPSARQNPFSLSSSPSESRRDGSKEQQLSPFMQPSSSSPTLPPISSLANLQLQSPLLGDIGSPRSSDRHSVANDSPIPPFIAPPQQASVPARSAQPEPIFIQEEPWNVQKKRNSSNANGKTQASKQASSKKNQEKEVDQLTEEPPLSPTSSVASSASSPNGANHRKRPSQKDGFDGKMSTAMSNSIGSKRAKNGEDDDHVIVVEELGTSASDKSGPRDHVAKEARDADAAQALTSLAQNSV
ncbi:hypothetical protein BGX31_009136 [Mortierella sp. GBA43]|nr:hypothetical protein BGX31_009136 [Mortierella sp. GBA43]